jgi:hypothetical protein
MDGDGSSSKRFHYSDLLPIQERKKNWAGWRILTRILDTIFDDCSFNDCNLVHVGYFLRPPSITKATAWGLALDAAYGLGPPGCRPKMNRKEQSVWTIVVYYCWHSLYRCTSEGTCVSMDPSSSEPKMVTGVRGSRPVGRSGKLLPVLASTVMLGSGSRGEVFEPLYTCLSSGHKVQFVVVSIGSVAPDTIAWPGV